MEQETNDLRQQALQKSTSRPTTIDTAIKQRN